MVNKIKYCIRTGFLFMSVTISILIALLTFMYFAATNMKLAEYVPDGLRASSLFAVEARPVTSPFRYTFNADGILNEAESMAKSTSPYFWLNSGGRFYMENGIGKTIHGPYERGLLWQILYAQSSSVDTEGGLYPQNLFRFITRSTWKNVAHEVRFNITRVNKTNTPNRGGWSGILLMSRYLDGNNLYYAGLRMDGSVIIKKKLKGTYYTLAQKALPYATTKYNFTTNPNLIPEQRWMRLKVETVTAPDNTVHLDVYLDENDDGVYVKILSAIDTAGVNGSQVLSNAGYMGIRTDYADVQFDDFILKNI